MEESPTVKCRGRMKNRFRSIVQSADSSLLLPDIYNKFRKDDGRREMSPSKGMTVSILRKATELSLQFRRRKNIKRREDPCMTVSPIHLWSAAEFKSECFRTQKTDQLVEPLFPTTIVPLPVWDGQPWNSDTFSPQDSEKIRSSNTYLELQSAVFDSQTEKLRQWGTSCCAIPNKEIGLSAWKTFRKRLRDPSYKLLPGFHSETLAWTSRTISSKIGTICRLSIELDCRADEYYQSWNRHWHAPYPANKKKPIVRIPIFEVVTGGDNECAVADRHDCDKERQELYYRMYNFHILHKRLQKAQTQQRQADRRKECVM